MKKGIRQKEVVISVQLSDSTTPPASIPQTELPDGKTSLKTLNRPVKEPHAETKMGSRTDDLPLFWSIYLHDSFFSVGVAQAKILPREADISLQDSGSS